MSEDFTYNDYVNDKKFLSDYNDYQARYAEQMRESDKVLIELLQKHIGTPKLEKAPKLLDIGCSTGNLLLHMKRMLPRVKMTGGDLALSSIEEARNNSELEGIDFQEMDIFNLPENEYDIVIANAVAVYFKWPDYQKALESVYKSLKPGGIYIVFEWMHPFEHQDLMIYETSISHPDGIRICFRPIKKVAQHLKKAGFDSSDFYPFEMPFDLEKPCDDEEVVTYTINSENNDRLSFRGALYQPWCHMVAKKSA